MPKTRLPMKLSPDEELYLRHWMYDEVHYADGPGAAKRLQLERRAVSADLATLIAAAFPSPLEQQAAGQVPPPCAVLTWPWRDDQLSARVREARSVLTESRATVPVSPS